jgi:hypothetical protein
VVDGTALLEFSDEKTAVVRERCTAVRFLGPSRSVHIAVLTFQGINELDSLKKGV